MNEQIKARRVVADFVQTIDITPPDAAETLERARIAADARQRLRQEQTRRLARVGAVACAVILLGAALFSVPVVRAFVAQVIESISGQSGVCQYEIRMDSAVMLESNARNGSRYQTAVYRVGETLVEIYAEPVALQPSISSTMPHYNFVRITGLPIGYDAFLIDDSEGVTAVLETDVHRIEITMKAYDRDLLMEILAHLVYEPDQQEEGQ